MLLVVVFTVAAIVSDQQWGHVAAAAANVGLILGCGAFYPSVYPFSGHNVHEISDRPGHDKQRGI